MENITDKTIFTTLIRSPQEIPHVRLLIDSIRTWGGVMADIPIIIFNVNPIEVSTKELEGKNVESIMLDVPENLRRYFYGDKVFASARAEELYPEMETIIWIDPACLVVNPPLEYQLQKKYDCAVRPVHIKNVGLQANDSLDIFWKRIYEICGVNDIGRTVETFVDKKLIRAYYNTHALSVTPAACLFRQWFSLFEKLLQDADYQQAACEDVWHKVFLHQAVLSALISVRCDADSVRILPPEYNYPYNLQDKVPDERRAAVLNDLVTVAYENRTLDPDTMDDIEVLEPLKGWLERAVHISPGSN